MSEKVVFVTGVFILLFLVISKINSPVGFAEISSTPAGVSVTIDDLPRGITPEIGMLEISLPPGKHTIVAVKEGYTGYLNVFYVNRGETKEIMISLEKIN